MTCPRRINGTFTAMAGRVDDLDLSERAPPESGAVLAQAIKDYCAKYPAAA